MTVGVRPRSGTVLPGPGRAQPELPARRPAGSPTAAPPDRTPPARPLRADANTGGRSDASTSVVARSASALPGSGAGADPARAGQRSPAAAAATSSPSRSAQARQAGSARTGSAGDRSSRATGEAGRCCSRCARRRSPPALRPSQRTAGGRRAVPGAATDGTAPHLPGRGRRPDAGESVRDAVLPADPVEQHLGRRPGPAEPAGELLAIVSEDFLRDPVLGQRGRERGADRPAGGPWNYRGDHQKPGVVIHASHQLALRAPRSRRPRPSRPAATTDRPRPFPPAVVLPARPTPGRFGSDQKPRRTSKFRNQTDASDGTRTGIHCGRELIAQSPLAPLWGDAPAAAHTPPPPPRPRHLRPDARAAAASGPSARPPQPVDLISHATRHQTCQIDTPARAAT